MGRSMACTHKVVRMVVVLVGSAHGQHVGNATAHGVIGFAAVVKLNGHAHDQQNACGHPHGPDCSLFVHGCALGVCHDRDPLAPCCMYRAHALAQDRVSQGRQCDYHSPYHLYPAPASCLLERSSAQLQPSHPLLAAPRVAESRKHRYHFEAEVVFSENMAFYELCRQVYKKYSSGELKGAFV